jgi:hypothetical protein
MFKYPQVMFPVKGSRIESSYIIAEYIVLAEKKIKEINTKVKK